MIKDENIRYLISSKWWEKWKDYANFNSDFLENNENPQKDDDQGSLSNDMEEESSVQNFDAFNYNSAVLYGRPGLITNQELL